MALLSGEPLYLVMRVEGAAASNLRLDGEYYVHGIMNRLLLLA